MVTVHAVLPSGPNVLRIFWTIPESACLLFTSLSVQCISSSNHQNTVRARAGALEANVFELNPNTLYSCRVTSNLADWQGTPLDHQTISNAIQNYTYPACEFPGVLLGGLKPSPPPLHPPSTLLPPSFNFLLSPLLTQPHLVPLHQWKCQASLPHQPLFLFSSPFLPTTS